MIKSKADYLKYISYEDKKMHTSYPHFTKEKEQILKFIKLYRKLEYYTNCHPKSLYLKYLKYKYNKLSNKYNFYIPINTIDKGLCIVHIGPIYINKYAKIGKDLRIHPLTTIGKSIGKGHACPTIKNGVWIGPGARIYGNIVIGNNVAIGANSVVTKSIPNNVTVGGVPAKIINHKGYTNYYKEDIYE